MPAVVSTDPDWIMQSACRRSGLDPDSWFPLSPDCRDANLARIVCDTCPVQAECLQESLKHADTVGIWGGLDENERRLALRRRARKVRRE